MPQGPSDPLTAWLDANTALFDAWLQLQRSVWSPYQDLMSPWTRLCQDHAYDWAARFGGMRGAEQLA